MSVEIVAKIICDECGSQIIGPVIRGSTGGMETYWCAKMEAEERRWLINQRYGKARHICQSCADYGPGAQPKETIQSRTWMELIKIQGARRAKTH